jgi:hypothetical protein
MINQHFARKLNVFRGNSRISDVFIKRDFYSRNWSEFIVCSNFLIDEPFRFYISNVFTWR